MLNWYQKDTGTIEERNKETQIYINLYSDILFLRRILIQYFFGLSYLIFVVSWSNVYDKEKAAL